MPDYTEIIQSLNRQGWAIRDDAISDEWRAGLLGHAQRLWDAGQFQPGEIGRSADGALQPTIRGDAICWVEPASPVANHPFFDWMAGLRAVLNRDFDMGLRSQEFHFARYENRAGYRKHIDQHRGTDYRKISIVLYLNPHWDVANGGELCVYEPYHPEVEAGRFAPFGARMAVFLSGVVPHAVLPTLQPRWSLTGWLRTDLVTGKSAAGLA